MSVFVPSWLSAPQFRTSAEWVIALLFFRPVYRPDITGVP
jgi:hypothetical protein